jgi:hypothetical protein
MKNISTTAFFRGIEKGGSENGWGKILLRKDN